MRLFLILLLAGSSLSGWGEKKRRHVDESGLAPPEKGSVLDEKGGKPLPGKKLKLPDGHSDIRPTRTDKPVPVPSPGITDKLPGDPSPAAAPCRRPPSLESLLRLPRPRDLQSAPEGAVYFLLERTLHRLTGPGGSPETVASDVDVFAASPEGTDLVLVAHREEASDLRLRIGNETRNPLRRPGIVNSARWAPGAVYFTTETGSGLVVSRLDLKESRIADLGNLDGPHFLSDVSPDGKYLALTRLRPSAGSEALLWEVATGKRLAVGTGRARDPRFTADGKGLFFLQEKRDHYQLHTARVAAPSRGHALTGGGWGVEAYALGPRRTALAYRVNEDGYSRLKGLLVDESGRQRRNLPVPALPPGVIEDMAFARGADETALFFLPTASRVPPEIWLSRGGRAERWSSFAADRVDPACLTGESLVRYPALDKRSIPAFLYSAAPTHDPAPYVLWVEGMPERQFRPRFHPFVQYLLERGFGVFAPNVRGREGYGRSYQVADDGADRLNAYGDVVAGARWLHKRKLTTPGLLALVGDGYGGWLALRAIGQAPEAFAGASLTSPWLEFGPPLAALSPLWRPLGEAEFGRATDGALMQKLSALGALEALKAKGTPLEAVQGPSTDDARVARARSLVVFLESITKKKGSR